MLGERGLWYKMTFFEGACRVPLIVHAPGVRRARVKASVSHLDLLPTLVDLGRGAPPARRSTAGASCRTFRTPDAHDEAIGEYLGEGAIAPIVMVRRGASSSSIRRPIPINSIDLTCDPQERANLVDNPACAGTCRRLSR